MMRLGLLTTALDSEAGIVAARQRARQVADHLGFDQQDQTRIATAVSEIARNAYKYAGGGKVEFALVTGRSMRPTMEVAVTDQGPGIHDLDSVLAGTYVSPTGMGLGIVGAKRLMDEFEVLAAPRNGTVVRMAKRLPRRAMAIGKAELARITEDLARSVTVDPVQEVARQNRELLESLEELRLKQEALVHLNRELEETNRGVLALYAELDEKAEHLRQAHELKSRILSHVSHEFRTPVNSMMALSRMLLDHQDGTLNDEQRSQAQFINQAARELSDLVNDLLDLARIEAGKTGLTIEGFEVAELFGTLRGMLKPLVAPGAVSLEVEDVDGVPPLCTDKGKLAQILRNLLSNALKFTEAGWVRLSAELMEDGGMVAFVVADTGIGIASEHLQDIFEEFSQIHSPVHSKAKGTGLGLSLSRRLAGLLGGTITVSSELGRGSRFTLLIPRVHPQARAEPEDGPPAGGVTVLVVDDDPDARAQLCGLMPGGMSVGQAEDGARALAAVGRDRPRLILLDLVMPGLDGFATLNLLKSDPRTAAIPVVICTSLSLTDDDRRQLRAADDFLNKANLDAVTLSAVLRRWIGEAHG